MKSLLAKIVLVTGFVGGLLFLKQELSDALRPTFRALDKLATNHVLVGESEFAEGQILSACFSENGRRLFLATEKEETAAILIWEEGSSLRKIPLGNKCLSSKLLAASDGLSLMFLASERGQNGCRAKPDDSQASQLMVWQEGYEVSTILPKLFSGKWEIEATPTLEKVLVMPQSDQVLSPVILRFKRDKRNGSFEIQNEGTNLFLQNQDRLTESLVARDDFQLLQMNRESMQLLTGSTVAALKLTKLGKPGPKTPRDFDVDGATDLVVYDSQSEVGVWYVYSMSGVDGARNIEAARFGNIRSYQLGPANSLPVEGDYDGDGLIDFATYTPGDVAEWQHNQGLWQIHFSETKAGWVSPSDRYLERRWGGPEEQPRPGDYDGDGLLDLAVYNPRHAVWKILFSKDNWDIARFQAKIPTAGLELTWGAPGDLAINGDFDGDGRHDPGSYRPAKTSAEKSSWRVFYLPSSSGKQRPSREIFFGNQTSIPTPGDFNCDGATELAVYSPEQQQWSILIAGKTVTVDWGIANGRPLVGDYDGDGCSDFAFYIPPRPDYPSFIHWAILPSSLGRDPANIDIAQGVVTRIPWRPMAGKPTELQRGQWK